MSDEICVRRARPEDASGVNEIYNPVIRDSAASFETEEYSEAKRRDWLSVRVRDLRHPVFVAIGSKDRITGFASAGPFDERSAYGTSVKTSVFVAPDYHGQGVGGLLYTALFKALENTSVHRAYALVVSPNPASAALHQQFGFTHISTLSEVGWKHGAWRDVMWFEKKFDN